MSLTLAPNRSAEKEFGPKETSYFDAYPKSSLPSQMQCPDPSPTAADFDPFSTIRPSHRAISTMPSYAMASTSSQFAPTLRYSGSSSNSQTIDTPPRTPTSPVAVQIVAGPSADIETMDALIDGINAFDNDDILTGSGLQHHNKRKPRSKAKAITKHRSFDHQPPLPIPPAGVVLQSTTTHHRSGSRIPRPKRKAFSSPPAAVIAQQSFPNRHLPSSTAEEEENMLLGFSKPNSPHSPLSNTSERDFKHDVILSSNINAISQSQSAQQTKKFIIPSISEIVRNHVSVTHNQRPAPERRSEDLTSRSSFDSIAEEAQHTLRQPLPPPVKVTRTEKPYSSPLQRAATVSHSQRSTPNRALEKPHSYSFDSGPVSQSESIATYLRSTRLTTLLQLPRSLQPPLQVSLSDLGDPNGRPLVVFLGLGSVRYLMGLYDEMAELLGLRLITIDRWGMGWTSTDGTNPQGIREWGRVVCDVLDRLGIEHCSVLAHSAGAPYALSFANMRPQSIKGDICLLAPWVGGGESAGYKWLKYIPNGLVKTAQAAEWRMQTWMLGKPPSLNHRGIGFDRKSALSAPPFRRSKTEGGSTTQALLTPPDREDTSDVRSFGSSDYDDLADFDGRFDSRSTVGSLADPTVGRSSFSFPSPSVGGQKWKKSGGILGTMLGRNNPGDRSASSSSLSHSTKAPILKSLRSIGSLKGSSRSAIAPSTKSQPAPSLPSIGLEYSHFEVPQEASSPSLETTDSFLSVSDLRRTTRSVSLTSRSSTAAEPLAPPSNSFGYRRPNSSITHPSGSSSGTVAYQGALANALIAASHAESSKGVHTDLMHILNHEGKSWGFSYASYPHKLRVWYGDKDERIAEGAVRWMEKSMPSNMCEVNVIKGADHNLMYRSGLIVEVLESIRSAWT